jgi:hypothetical protein
MMMMPNGMGMPPLLRLPVVLAPFLGWRPAVAQHVGCAASSGVSSSNNCGEVSGLEIEAASSLLVLQHLLPEDHPGVEPHTNSTDWQCRRHWLLQLAATNVHLGVQSLSLLLARTQSVTGVSSLLKRSGTGTAAPFGMILVYVLIVIGLIMASWFFYIHSKTYVAGPAHKPSTTGGTEQLLSGSASSSPVREPWSRDAAPPRSSTGGLSSAQIPVLQQSRGGTNFPPPRPSAKKVMVPALPLEQLNQQNQPEPLPPEFLQMMSPAGSTPATSASVTPPESGRQNGDPGPSIKMLLRCLDRDEGLPDGPGTGHARSSQPASFGSSAAGAAVPVFMGPTEAASHEVRGLIDGFECNSDALMLGGLDPVAGTADSQAGGHAPDFGVPPHTAAMNPSKQHLVQFLD